MGLALANPLASLMVYSLPTKLMTLQNGKHCLLGNEGTRISRTRWFHPRIQRRFSHDSMREPANAVRVRSRLIKPGNSRTIGLSSGIARPLNAFGSALVSKSPGPCARALHAPLIAEMPRALGSNVGIGGWGISSVGASVGEGTKVCVIRAVAISSYVETNTWLIECILIRQPLEKRLTYPAISSQA